jgi:hypothetical protein
MASCRARAAARHDHVSMRRQRRRSMPSGGVWGDSALSRRGSNDRLARCALLSASGLEIVRQEAAENIMGALATPNVLAVSRGIGREALGQDALKSRFVGSAVLQVMVVAAAGA